MDTQKNQITDRLNQATNVLVAVSANPSVDQLAGAIGITLLLNKLGKHATAVFSGQVPSTIEFLQPEKTLEKNTDSLRDFIIALDKSKADKLRYKVEDQMVKIFITPYRTSISDKDLEFSQGDFNVEVVLAIGVNEQQDLDQAITSHGRILHDATVIGVSTHDGAALGSINWSQPAASSLSEMLLDLGLTLKADVLDSQMATAFLTGIVAETERFSNEKTTSETMQMSAKLMAAGANQQLVASQLQPQEPEAPATAEVSVNPSDEASAKEEDAELPAVEQVDDTADSSEQSTESADGALQINHNENSPETSDAGDGSESEDPDEDALEQIHIDEAGQLKPLDEFVAATATDQPAETVSSMQPADSSAPPSRFVMQPPVMGGKLTANSQPEALDPSTDPLGATNAQAPLLSHEGPLVGDAVPQDVAPAPGLQPAIEDIIGTSSGGADLPPPAPLVTDDQSPNTLSDLEQVVDSPHLGEAPVPPVPALGSDVNLARDAVLQAVAGSPQQLLEPVQSLNAQPMDLNLGDMPAVATSPASAFADPDPIPVAPAPPPITDPGLPANITPDFGLPQDVTTPSVQNPIAPPPVPPPMMPPAMPPMTDPSAPNTNPL